MRELVLIGGSAVIAAALCACSVADQRSPDIINGVTATTQTSAAPKPATPTSTHLTTYFVDNDSRLVPVSRADPYSGLNVAIGELLAGPSSDDLSGGLTSAIPVGTKLFYASISGTTAHLDFSSELASISGHEQLLAFAQIVMTATSTPGISLVQISVVGQPVNAPEPNGTLAQGPVTASDYSSLLRS